MLPEPQGRIALSLEFPSSLLSDLSPLCDFDFVLAHQVLKDANYANFFRERSKGRTVILDNSIHELGSPGSVESILIAANLVRADYIVAPDFKNYSPWWTLEQTWLTVEGRTKLNYPNFHFGAVLSGRSAEEREGFLRGLPPEIDLLCIPYDTPRLQWFLELNPPQKRIHLLGMSTFGELAAWRNIAFLLYPQTTFSLDTGKPAKWGLLGRRIDDGRSLRKAPLSSEALLDLPRPSGLKVKDVLQNIQILKDFLQFDGLKGPFTARD